MLQQHAAAIKVWTDQLQAQLASVRAQYSAAAPGSANQGRADADVVVRLQQLSAIYRAQPPLLLESGAARALPDDTTRAWLVALVAFTAATLLALAIGALLSTRRGGALTPSSAQRLAHRGHSTYLQVPLDDLGSATLLPLRGDVARALSTGHQVLVLVAAGLTRGEAAALLIRAGADTTHLAVVDLDEPWWRYVDAAVVAEVVVVATDGAATVSQVEEATAAAAGMGATSHIVMLTATSSAPPPAPRSPSAALTGTPSGKTASPTPPAGTVQNR